MKNIPFRIIANFLFLALFFFACSDLKNIDVAKDLKFILNYKPADAFIEVQVKDAKTGELVTSKIDIEILGKETANVINFEGEAKTAYTKVGPSIYLGLRNILPSVEKPVMFKVIVGSEGYLSGSKEITMTEISTDPVEILLVKSSSPPAGVTIQQSDVISNATTGISQDKNIEVQNGQNTTIIEIDKGTIVKDTKGTVLTGTLQTTVAAFNGESQEAANSFPGGSVTTLTKDPTGDTNVEAVLLPISFVEVLIKDSNGKKVTTFSQPIDITFEINPETINPQTEKVVKVGESFSIFSYSDENGSWTYEKEGTIIKKGNELFVTFQTNHLSWFSVLAYIRSRTNGVLSNKYVPPSKTININVVFDKPIERNSISIDTYVACQPFYSGGSYITYLDHHLFRRIGTSYEYTATFVVPEMALSIGFKYELAGIPRSFKLNEITNNSTYKFNINVDAQLKTIFATVACENNCPVEIKPYNMGIQGIQYFDIWSFLGNISYDAADNKIKLKAFLRDNTNIKFRAVAYPTYTKVVNTGNTDSFTVPLLLTKEHPLCKCGK
ncbi:hypothetical protein [Emticicia sp. SJ17W-69]|uniref:hypothetical protein n=1 Tax=Emticicia sp. SJ17W-69 TaxID=3421657 RepID=UPI003EB6B2AC